MPNVILNAVCLRTEFGWDWPYSLRLKRGWGMFSETSLLSPHKIHPVHPWPSGYLVGGELGYGHPVLTRHTRARELRLRCADASPKSQPIPPRQQMHQILELVGLKLKPTLELPNRHHKVI